jgi:thiamine-phosphate pyrophosphorylase
MAISVPGYDEQFRMRLPLLYPILDTTALSARACSPVHAAEAMIEAGVEILQFRHKEHFSRSMFSQAERTAEMCREAGVLFVLDDRADIALMLNAALHLGQDDLEPMRARAILGPVRKLGFSTHNEVQLRASEAEPCDYVALGPVFATASKSNPDPVLGVAELKRLRPLTSRPLVAIGGITRATASEAIAAGADSVAVIGDLLPEDCTRASIRQRMEEWIRLLRRT